MQRWAAASIRELSALATDHVFKMLFDANEEFSAAPSGAAASVRAGFRTIRIVFAVSVFFKQCPAFAQQQAAQDASLLKRSNTMALWTWHSGGAHSRPLRGRLDVTDRELAYVAVAGRHF